MILRDYIMLEGKSVMMTRHGMREMVVATRLDEDLRTEKVKAVPLWEGQELGCQGPAFRVCLGDELE